MYFYVLVCKSVKKKEQKKKEKEERTTWKKLFV